MGVAEIRVLQLIDPGAGFQARRGAEALARCRLVGPGVEFARVRRRRDPALRAALGFGERDRVLLLPGESTRSAGHREALWAAAILRVVEPAYRVLAWRRGPRTSGLE